MTLGMNSRQSGLVRLSPEFFLAVLFNFETENTFWIHKAMIKYDITVTTGLVSQISDNYLYSTNIYFSNTFQQGLNQPVYCSWILT